MGGRRYIYDREMIGEDDYSSDLITESDIITEFYNENTNVIFSSNGTFTMRVCEGDSVANYSGTWTMDSKNYIPVYFSSSDYEDEVHHILWRAERDQFGNIRIFIDDEVYVTMSEK